MSNQPGFWLATRQLSLAALLLGLLQSTALAANCTYREDALGHTRYRCDDGKQSTLREDALGNIKDTGTGITWRKDALGNLKGYPPRAPANTKKEMTTATSAVPALSPESSADTEPATPPASQPAQLTP